MTEASYRRPIRTLPRRPKTLTERIFVPCAPLELSSFVRIDWVLRAMISEFKSNHGKYPYSSRMPGTREVLRRAHLSNAFLERQGGNEYRESEKFWYKRKVKRVLSRLRCRRYLTQAFAPGGKYQTETEPASWNGLRQELHALKQRWCVAELEFVDAQARVAELEASCQELSGENQRLQKLLGETNIHILR